MLRRIRIRSVAILLYDAVLRNRENDPHSLSILWLHSVAVKIPKRLITTRFPIVVDAIVVVARQETEVEDDLARDFSAELLAEIDVPDVSRTFPPGGRRARHKGPRRRRRARAAETRGVCVEWRVGDKDRHARRLHALSLTILINKHIQL